MKTCSTCKHFDRSSDEFGLCLQIDNFIGSDKGMDIVMGKGIILVGQNFGCIHYESKRSNISKKKNK
jgi:hypothetical protein